MANTYVLIASNVLTSSAASVTFSSIPSTYTDLVIRTSIRDNSGAEFATAILQPLSANGLYSFTRFWGGGAAGYTSTRTSGANDWTLQQSTNGDSSTANVFSSNEYYFPSYTTSQQKVASFFNATESNSTVAYINRYAAYVQSTSTITSIPIYASSSFATGSSFYLYGIKNS